MNALAALFGALAPFEAVLFLLVALVVGIVAAGRKRRPLSMSRAMDVVLSTILFVLLGLRFAILCAVTVLFPSAMLIGAGPALKPMVAALYAIAAVIGFATHRGSVGARVLGAAALAAVVVIDLALYASVLQQSLRNGLDQGLSLLFAVAACVCAAFFWTYRTAAPNPLGGDKRPLDY